jgi:hypothetical protein
MTPFPFVSLQIVVTGDIARPNDPVDQRSARALCLCGGAHDARHPDATPEKRRPGRGFWRRRDREYFRRPDHQCAHEVHRVARGDFLSPHFCPVDSLRAEGEHAEQSDQQGDSGNNARAGGFCHTSPRRFCFGEPRCERECDSQSSAFFIGRSFGHGNGFRACSHKPGAVRCNFSGAGQYSRAFAEVERRAFRFLFAEAVVAVRC